MEELSFSFYIPLIAAAIVYVVMYIGSAVVRTRGDEGAADRLLDAGFGVALVAAVYVVVLLLVAIFDMPNEIGDLLAVIFVIGLFFLLLVSVFFALFEFLFSRGGRRG